MIAMLSDVTVASDRATFRAPELFRGIADTNYAQILPRQIGPARARDMLLTGRVVDAAEALDWGLISRVVPHAELLVEATSVLEQCSQSAPDARLAIKNSFDRYYGAFDRISMDASLQGPEALEGYLAFKERRAPGWVPPPLRRLAGDPNVALASGDGSSRRPASPFGCRTAPTAPVTAARA